MVRMVSGASCLSCQDGLIINMAVFFSSRPCVFFVAKKT